jgi:hypothetical protein
VAHEPTDKQLIDATKEDDRRLITSAIVLRRDKKKNRDRYTEGTKSSQRLAFGISKAGYRVANSFAEGMNTFVKRSDDSRERRKDGFIRDSLRNASRGISDGFEELGKAPMEIADRIGTRQVWRIARTFTPFFR